MISSSQKTFKNVRNLRAFVKSSLTRQKVKQLNVFRRRVERCLEDATEYFLDGWLESRQDLFCLLTADNKHQSTWSCLVKTGETHKIRNSYRHLDTVKAT